MSDLIHPSSHMDDAPYVPEEKPEQSEYMDRPAWQASDPCKCTDPERTILSGRYCSICGNVVPGH